MSTVIFTFLLSLTIFISKTNGQLTCNTLSTDKYTKGIENKNNKMCFKFYNFNSAKLVGKPGIGPLVYFTQITDDYTLISLTDSKLHDNRWKPSDNGTDPQIAIEAGGITSELRKIRSVKATMDNEDRIVQQLTAVITLNDGKVDSIKWDDECGFCSKNNCVDGKNCGIPVGDCISSTPADCDVKIYIAWYGTDSNGDYLLSAGQRVSQFQDNTAESYYKYVRDNLKTLANV